MTKGLKTSELWVVVLMILPHILNAFGISATQTDLVEIPKHITDLAKVMQAQGGDSGSGTTILAAVYVAGRQILKWKEAR